MEVERELVRQALEQAGGNQTHAAELLGLERDALRRQLIKYGFHHPNATTARRSSIPKKTHEPMKRQHGWEQSGTERILPDPVGKGYP